MKPALTPEEWKRVQQPIQLYGDDGKIWVPARQRWQDIVLRDEGETNRPDATAALALYGQPFGFSREDVEELRGAIDDVRSNIQERGTDKDAITDMHGKHPTVLRLQSLADRIEALLPPEG